ncbi:pectinesterase-like [Apium graveolens]|uniref:pectinesterase-like n=1 Tax=Apium graveolens TaxID=4045 RepID=UPI003D793C8C
MDRIASVSTFLFICLLVFAPTMVVHGATGSLCSHTPYPELCTSSMISSKLVEETTSFLVHRDSALSATMAQAVQAHRLISDLDTSSYEERAKSAWADCLEHYEDSINQLNRSMSITNPNKDNNDVQTWLSSALTNHQTCQDGFADFNLSNTYLNSFPVNNFTKFLGNSLAINKAVMASQTSGLSSQNPKGRHLLAHDLPDWISISDRKLLQATAPKPDLVVAQDGSGNYRTISQAVAAAKTGNKRFVIYVKKGVYKENVEIKKSMKNLMLVGDGIDATVVTASKSNADGATTFRSATFAASGDGLIVRGMTFENTAGPQSHQAVAVRSGSDLSVFYSCSFKGYQDTLYVYSQRQFYRNCDIYGTVDFIFGNAAAVLQNCNIYVRKPMSNQFNTVTAQGRTDPNQNTGIVLHNCRVTAGSDLKAVQGSFKTYLGRPWKQYSRTVVIKSILDSLIDSTGWLPWSGDFALKTLYYGEFMNTGNGAGTGGRVKWPGYHVITGVQEAGRFSVGSFLNGNSWLAATGVPFTSGL